MSNLTLNGIDQYVTLDTPFVAAVDGSSRIVVTIDNLDDAGKVFDSAAGNVAIIQPNKVQLSEITAPVTDIGRNVTGGTFYAGAITSIELLTPGTDRFVTPTAEGNISSPSLHAALFPTDIVLNAPWSLSFKLFVPSAAQVGTKLTLFEWLPDESVYIDLSSGDMVINDVFAGGDYGSAPPPPVNVITDVRIERLTNSVDFYYDDVLVRSTSLAFTTQQTFRDIYGESNSILDIGYFVFDCLYTDLTQSFFYPVDESSGDKVFAATAGDDMTWDVPDPVRLLISLDGSDAVFELDEGAGSTLTDTSTNLTATIQNFVSDVWVIPPTGLFLIFNTPSAMQYLQSLTPFVPDDADNATIVATIDTINNAGEVFDSALGVVTVLSGDEVELSAFSGAVAQIGRDVTGGQFYAGGITKLIYTSPGGARSRMPTNLNNAVSISPTIVLGVPWSISFDMLTGDNDGEDIVLLASAAFDYRIIYDFTLSTLSVETDADGVLISTAIDENTSYQVVISMHTETHMTISLDAGATLAASTIVAITPVFEIDSIYSAISNTPGWFVFNVQIIDETHNVFYALNEQSGTAIRGVGINVPTATWLAAETRLSVSAGPAISITYEFDESTGSFITALDGDAQSIINNFQSSQWSAGSTPVITTTDTTQPALDFNAPNVKQQGDVFLFASRDGADIVVENGLVKMTESFETLSYLALFGGNENDSGVAADPNNWWGNVIEQDPSRTYRSRTQYILKHLAATTGNIAALRDAVITDIEFILTERIASETEVTITLPALNRVSISVTITAQGEQQEFNFTENWAASI